jgi:hypothetical protein
MLWNTFVVQAAREFTHHLHDTGLAPDNHQEYFLDEICPLKTISDTSTPINSIAKVNDERRMERKTRGRVKRLLCLSSFELYPAIILGTEDSIDHPPDLPIRDRQE